LYWVKPGRVREPASWLLALAALYLAVAGFRWHDSAAAVAVLAGFTVHEASHRIVARKGGMRAEFVATPEGLLLTVASAVFPIKILAPGYVEVWGYRLSPKWALYSVAAGPLSNIILAAASLAALQASPQGALFDAIEHLGEINAWFAVFNLLPLNPLDGSKIFSYDKRIWLLLTVLALALYSIAYAV
jgi:Zn-dependent protease